MPQTSFRSEKFIINNRVVESRADNSTLVASAGGNQELTLAISLSRLRSFSYISQLQISYFKTSKDKT